MHVKRVRPTGRRLKHGQFAAATLGRLGLMNEKTRAAYEAVMWAGDASAFPALMGARAA